MKLNQHTQDQFDLIQKSPAKKLEQIRKELNTTLCDRGFYLRDSREPMHVHFNTAFLIAEQWSGPQAKSRFIANVALGGAVNPLFVQ